MLLAAATVYLREGRTPMKSKPKDRCRHAATVISRLCGSAALFGTVAAAVFLSASAASAVEDATLSADQMLPACAAFIADRAPREIDGVFQAGRCIGLMQGLGYASRLLGVCPPDEVTEAQR